MSLCLPYPQFTARFSFNSSCSHVFRDRTNTRVQKAGV